MSDFRSNRSQSLLSDEESLWEQQDLSEIQKTIRGLRRQLSKEQARHAEITRAYKLTVANLVEAKRQNTLLTSERNVWQARAEGHRANITFGDITPTPEEVNAIRKAMARLYHPDSGGDVERMKLWNATLDPLDE